MKGGFWGGVASAVLAGVVLFFIQDEYKSWQEANSAALDIRINDDVAVFNSTELKAMEESAGPRGSLRIASITARNAGSRPITSQAVHFSSQFQTSSPIRAYGVVPSRGADSSTVVIEPKSQGFDVTFRSLDRGASQTFWVAYECCEIFGASPITPNLMITQSVSDYDDTYPNWKWFERFAVFAVAFLIGVVVESSIFALRLRRRGLSSTELMNRPKLEKKGEENA